jgi:hypothetical protein
VVNRCDHEKWMEPSDDVVRFIGTRKYYLWGGGVCEEDDFTFTAHKIVL